MVDVHSASISRICLIDIDRVEQCNLGNQLYKESDAGEYKATATKNRIRDKGYTGTVETHVRDIDVPAKVPQSILECNVYISALDSYQSRVNFWYYIVQEAVPKDILYVDTGTERFLGHCFYVSGKKPCIYCIKWLFPDPRKIGPLCGIRGEPPSSFNEETKLSFVMSILYKEYGKGEENPHEKAAAEYNRIYNPEVKLSFRDVVTMEEHAALPNTPAVSFILANIVSLVLKKKPSGNFILYSGDGTPLFQQHFLSPDPSCFLCSE